jgi:peroxiredoxin Q/BCP
MADAIEGKALPSLSLEATKVGKVELPKDFLGKVSIIYFYPKDDTPGCTKQACSYRDDSATFRELGIALYGVSLDDLTSHDAFSTKFSLDFPLISDPEHKLADFFGVYGEREWNGKKFMGLSRDSFLIDAEGKVVRAFRRVDPTTTANETLAAARALTR